MQEQIRQHLLAQLATGPKSIAMLASTCRGVFPSTLKAMVDELTIAGVVVQRDTMIMLSAPSQRSTALRTTEATIDDAPEPHQANYEWRFTGDTAHALVQRVFSHTPDCARLCYLGTPTVYFAGITQHPGIEHVLVDTATPIVAFLRNNVATTVLVHDVCIGTPLLDGKFQAVLMDPPWYPEYYPAFIRAAGELLVTGGYAYMSLFPLFVRPSAPQERTHILQVAAEADLAIVAIEEAALTYTTPPFEAATLTSIGISSDPAWRNADLLIMMKLDHKIESPPRPPTRAWDEWVIGKQVIKVRRRDEYRASKLLDQLPSGPTLPTVSRTHRELDDVDIWTSRNRVFRTNNVTLVRSALNLLQAGHTPESITQSLINEHPLITQNVQQEAVAEMVATFYQLVQE